MLLLVPPTPVLVPLLVVFLPVKPLIGKIAVVMPMYVLLKKRLSLVVKLFQVQLAFVLNLLPLQPKT
jgi:hypothetical protein